MSKNTKPPSILDQLSPQAKDIAEILGVNPENVVHISLAGAKDELIGEIVLEKNLMDYMNIGAFESKPRTKRKKSRKPKSPIQFSPDSKSFFVINPLRVMSENWIDENGNVNSITVLCEWNSFVENPWIEIQSTAIQINPQPVNIVALHEYLYALEKTYSLDKLFDDLVVDLMEQQADTSKKKKKSSSKTKPTETISVLKSSSNIIDFNTYFKNKTKL